MTYIIRIKPNIEVENYEQLKDKLYEYDLIDKIDIIKEIDD